MKLVLFITIATASLLHRTSAEWSECSKTCGGGSQWQQVCMWGFCQGKRFRRCNTQACVGGWDTWSPCSKTCGGGSRFKVTRCAANDVLKCPKTYGDCNEQACQALDACPAKHAFRYRDKSSCCKRTRSQCGRVDKSVFKRIVGGKKAKLGQWPWAIVIYDKKLEIGRCAATLLHPSWAVTAKHCFAIGKENMKLIFGTISIKSPASGSQTRDVSRLVPYSDDHMPIHDIGLIRFKRPVTYSPTIKPICMPSGERTLEDKKCYAAGWGIANPADIIKRIPSDILMQVDLRILPLDACVLGYRGTIFEHGPTNETLCAGRHGGVKDACSGDSGGPLICQRCTNCDWYLAGVTSFGAVDCGKANRPGVYAAVRHYEQWIKMHVPLGNTGFFLC